LIGVYAPRQPLSSNGRQRSSDVICRPIHPNAVRVGGREVVHGGRPVDGQGGLRHDGEGLLVGGKRLLDVLRPIPPNAVSIGVREVIHGGRPVDGQGGLRHDGEGLLVGGKRLLDVLRPIPPNAARATLLGIHRARGLEALMHQAELGAMENGYLSGDRTDTRLFRDGPPDRFETLAQRLEGEINPYWNTSGERIESPPDETQEPGSWEELLAAETDEQPEPERHYWQMHYRPVETPDGEKLGTALFVTEFPQLPPDFDDYIDENGMDDTVYPTEARTLEMAHFADEKDAAKFDAEFRGYLVPDVLDGPELAPEVAKLEGLSGEWEDMDYRGIVNYMSGKRTVVREADSWHPYNPNAEMGAESQLTLPKTDIDF